MTAKHTRIASIGEFGLIERLKERCASIPLPEDITKQIVVGINDDTAVVRPSPDKLQLSTSDVLVEGVHFDLTYTSMQHLGWKLMVVNLSDIAAMGGIPLYAIITLALPAKISVEMVDELYDGIARAAETYRCAIAGGDTNTSLGNMFLSATVIGEIPEASLKKRDGAIPGDLLCVSGNLGVSYAGLKVLQREKQRYIETKDSRQFIPELDEYKEAVAKHLAPRARFDIAQQLARNIQVHAMIDVSDGLISDLRHICKQSKVGAYLYENHISIHPLVNKIAGEFNEPALNYILYGGEEYELLFTIHPEQKETILQISPDIRIIGTITEDENKIILKRGDGIETVIGSGGWDHFPKDT